VKIEASRRVVYIEADVVDFAALADCRVDVRGEHSGM
jgi:hypothetical protein